MLTSIFSGMFAAASWGFILGHSSVLSLVETAFVLTAASILNDFPREVCFLHKIFWEHLVDCLAPVPALSRVCTAAAQYQRYVISHWRFGAVGPNCITHHRDTYNRTMVSSALHKSIWTLQKIQSWWCYQQRTSSPNTFDCISYRSDILRFWTVRNGYSVSLRKDLATWM